MDHGEPRSEIGKVLGVSLATITRYCWNYHNLALLRNLADRECGMLKSCAIFHPAWLLQTILLWPLAPLVLHRLTFFAMMKHTQVEQIKVQSHAQGSQPAELCGAATHGAQFAQTGTYGQVWHQS